MVSNSLVAFSSNEARARIQLGSFLAKVHPRLFCLLGGLRAHSSLPDSLPPVPYAAPLTGFQPEADRRTAVPGVVVPAAAEQHAGLLASFSTRGVGCLLLP